MPSSHLDKTLVGLAGEFLVAGHLCLKGYVASLTLKNYPGVDIFCLNPRNGRQVAIQVKTIHGHRGGEYFVPENVDALVCPFVFVFIGPDESVEFFVVPAERVAHISAQERDDYLRAHPKAKREQPRMIRKNSLLDYKDRWDLLGLE